MMFRFRGFTLIELMVALAIFGFLLMLAGPMYGLFMANSQIRNEGEAILNGVQQAQARAIRNNSPARLVVDPTTGTGGWLILVADPTTNTVPAADPATPCGVRAGPACAAGQTCNPVQLFCAMDGAPDAALTRTPGDATTVTFDGFGRLQCNTDSALACDGSANLEWIDVKNSKNSSARKLRVCITNQQAPAAVGSIPVAASQIKLCDPNVAATEPQACPAACS
jgi:prepilin-type N-terminal cleavage/methylation domain-containing protein